MNALNRLHIMPRLTAENWAGKLWPSVAAIALGIMLARWTWILLAPASMAVLPPAETAASEDAGNLFGVAISSVAGTGMEVLPGARLVGVFALVHNAVASASNNKNGFAVLQLDEKHQAGAVLGAEVAPGVRLSEIYADHVVLERDGITQRVNLEEAKLKENPITEFVSKPPSPTMGISASAVTASLPPTRMPDGAASHLEMMRQMRERGLH